MKATLICLILNLSFAIAANAQIVFTDSNSRVYTTALELTYDENKISFSTGRYRSVDYRFEKLSDSLCADWIVTACFNAECRNDLLDSGHFIDDYNPDTANCFIAFHMFSLGREGRTKIQYRVVNTKDSNDHAVMRWDVVYHNPLSLRAAEKPAFSVYPNPATESWTISGLDGTCKLQLMDASGKILPTVFTVVNDGQIHMDAAALANGLYTLRIETGTAVRNLKLLRSGGI